MDLDPFVPVGIDARDRALPRRLPAALPAAPTARPTRPTRSPRSRATSSAPRRAGASRACGSSAAAARRRSSSGAPRCSRQCAPIAAALDAAHGGEAHAAGAAQRAPAAEGSRRRLPSARVLATIAARLPRAPSSSFGRAQSRADQAGDLVRLPFGRRRAGAASRAGATVGRGAGAPRGRRHDALRDLPPAVPGYPPPERLMFTRAAAPRPIRARDQNVSS